MTGEEVDREKFGEIVKRSVDKNGSAAITFSHSERFASGQEYHVERKYLFGELGSIIRGKYDKEDLGEVGEDCRSGIKSMMKPYEVEFSGNTATITPPRKSLEGLAGEQRTLF
ncbi:hypothetical protein HOD88_00360 [archaeon]|jgi:hypothetical protein|nr:hypothetical protein [archaeon]